MAAKMSEAEFKLLQQKTGINIPDPVAEAREAERKRAIDLQILLDAGTIEDRQRAEYWKALNLAREKKEREAEEDREDARIRQRKLNRGERVSATTDQKPTKNPEEIRKKRILKRKLARGFIANVPL